MKRSVLLSAGCVLLVGAICLSLARRNRELRRETAELEQRIARLEGAQAENAELKRRLVRQQGKEWQVERLRREAGEVHRLRAQTAELIRLRREHEEMIRYASGLTNWLGQLRQDNRDLAYRVAELSKRAAQAGRSGVGLAPGQSAPDSPRNWFGNGWANEGHDAGTAPRRMVVREVDGNLIWDFNQPGDSDAARDSTVARLPPGHPPTTRSCVSCHTVDELSPQSLGGLQIAWNFRAGRN